MMNDVVIKLENVSKYYKLYSQRKNRLKEALHPFGKDYHEKFYALQNINLQVKKGEILGIVGRNGSGKSTLLKIISRILEPNGGTVALNGKISALLELGAGFNPEFTGHENIMFHGTILDFEKEEMADKLDSIVKFADIGKFIDQPIKSYSSGMRARLGFALAVHVEPDILILDEVLAVGDALFRRKCYAKMEELFSGGCTILFVSHSISSVVDLCTRAIFIDDGKLIMEDNPKATTSCYQKYIFFNEDDKKKFRESLMSDNLSKDEGEICQEAYEKIDDKTHYVNNDYIKVPYFDQNYISNSSTIIKNQDVEIFDTGIVSDEGEMVNCLVAGRKYKYIFKVKFGLNISSVSYGIRIKTVKGINICRSNLKRMKSEIPSVRNGDTYEAEWQFDCLLLPNTYFIDVNVSGIVNGTRENLCKIKDEYVFKVLDGEYSQYDGLVFLNQKMSYKPI